ncbi:hypothetical protein ACFQ08_39840, partial [Streptosporangium algeriense]
LLAVSAIMASDEVALAPQEPAPLPADAIRRTPPEDALSVTITLWVSLLCLAGILLAVVLRFAVPRGRRRGWQPGHPGEQT